MSKLMSHNDVQCMNTPNLHENQAPACTHSMLPLFTRKHEKRMRVT